MRSIWNGSINFGLETIPIKMYSGSEERGLDLDMHDHARILYKRVNQNTGKEVEWKDIKNGLKIRDFNIFTMPERLEKSGDIFNPVLGEAIDMAKTLENLK